MLLAVLRGAPARWRYAVCAVSLGLCLALPLAQWVDLAAPVEGLIRRPAVWVDADATVREAARALEALILKRLVAASGAFPGGASGTASIAANHCVVAR